MSSKWTHAICADCWDKKNPERPALRTPEGMEQKVGASETCCYCLWPTRSGIYVREDPNLLKCRGIDGPVHRKDD
jgi:hypothetical protein